MRRNTLKVALLAATLAAPVTAMAGSELMTLLELLRDNGTITEAQYQRVVAEAQNNAKQKETETEVLKAELEKAKADDIQVSTKGKLTVKTRDGAFESSVGGRLQVDVAYYGEDGVDMGDATELRRARIYIKGKMYNDWLYKLQYDFAASNMIDAYVGYTGFEDTEILVGHFRDHTFLGDETSDTNIQFMERSLVNLAFDQGRHIGVGATRYGKNWLVSAGLFGDDFKKKGDASDEGWGIAGRAVFNPILEKGRVVHLGVFADQRNIRSTGDTISFSATPESHLGGVKLVNTGAISMVDHYLVSGLESAVSLGPWNAQAEYGQVDVSVDGMSDLDFDGWYVQTGYFLTGETRPYKKGNFDRVKPLSVVGQGGMGAWEVVARYSTLDLTDGIVVGGEEENFSLGVNWYPTDTLRFMANYVNVLEVDGGTYDGVEPDIFQMRAQWAF